MTNKNSEQRQSTKQRKANYPLFFSAIAGIAFSWVIVFTLPTHLLVTREVIHHHMDNSQLNAASQEFWACPMFCTRSDAPGTCPVCGMTLERFVDSGAQISLDSDVRRALSLQTEEVANRFLAREIRTVGIFQPDETSEVTVAAWVDGRIERMHGGYTGTPVKKGQALIDLYSPALYVAQKELILAKAYLSTITVDSRQYASRKVMLDLARDKIRLLGVPDRLASKIEEWDEPMQALTIQSRSNGIVLAKNIQEGDYVKEGQTLLKISDLRNLWLMLDIHEKDLSLLALNQKVRIQVDSFPGKQFYGEIGFIYPTLNPKTRTVQVRVEVSNEDLSLRPGMFGIATILARLASDGSVACTTLKGDYACSTHPLQRNNNPNVQCSQCNAILLKSSEIAGKNPGRILAVPKQAVLSTGNRHLVYVEWWAQRDQNGVMFTDDKNNPIPLEKPEYQGFEVLLGHLSSEWKKEPDGKLIKHGDYYPVISGLPPGIRVVTNAQFLIDSQMELTGKPSLLREKGGITTDPHANHQKK